MLIYFKLTHKTKSGETELEIKREDKGVHATRKFSGERRKKLDLTETDLENLENICASPEIEKFLSGDTDKSPLWKIAFKIDEKEQVEIRGNSPLSKDLPDIMKFVDPLIFNVYFPNEVDAVRLSFISKPRFSQEILIERKTSSLTIKEASETESAEHKFVSSEKIDFLLDCLSETADTLIAPQTLENDDIAPIYRLAVTYKNKEDFVLSGPYNRSGVPENFELFIGVIRKTLKDLEAPKGFLNPILEKCGKVEDGVIYLSVSFGGEKTYYYKTTDSALTSGQSVLVPTGEHGALQVGKIKAVEYFETEKVPYPLEKVKSAIMRVKETFSDTKSDKVELKRFLCIYIPFLTAVSKRESILEWCENYTEDVEEDDETGLPKLFEAMNKEAYLCGLVFKNYREMLKLSGITEAQAIEADFDYFENVEAEELAAAISLHFTLQTLNREEFYKVSVANGALLRLLLILDDLLNK